MLVWLAVVVYPIGITAFCALLLRTASASITHRHASTTDTLLARAIGFLYEEYDVTFFWWELMEMMRKFLLVGFFSTIQPGSILQVTIGTVFSAFYLMVRRQSLREAKRLLSQQSPPSLFLTLRPMHPCSQVQQQAQPYKKKSEYVTANGTREQSTRRRYYSPLVSITLLRAVTTSLSPRPSHC